MASKLDVNVAVNINSGTAAVTPTGNLTLQNVQALTRVAIRAAALAPDLTLTVSNPGGGAAPSRPSRPVAPHP